MGAKKYLIIFCVIILLTLFLIVWMAWKGYRIQKGEILITTDKTEYESGETLKVKIQNKFREQICFSSCYPYLLESKNENWESYKYAECQEFDGNGHCMKAGELKAFELTLPQISDGFHRLTVPVCVGCESEDTFRETKRFYSNEFTIKKKELGTCSPVSYEETLNFLKAGKIATIFQFHNLGLSVNLKDGRCFSTEQPKIDDILQQIEECGELCKDILFGTE